MSGCAPGLAAGRFRLVVALRPKSLCRPDAAYWRSAALPCRETRSQLVLKQWQPLIMYRNNSSCSPKRVRQIIGDLAGPALALYRLYGVRFPQNGSGKESRLREKCAVCCTGDSSFDIYRIVLPGCARFRQRHLLQLWAFFLACSIPFDGVGLTIIVLHWTGSIGIGKDIAAEVSTIGVLLARSKDVLRGKGGR